MKKVLFYLVLSICTGFVYGQTIPFSGAMLPKGHKMNTENYKKSKSKVRKYKIVYVETLPITLNDFKRVTDEELIGFVSGEYLWVNDEKREIYIDKATELTMNDRIDIALKQADIKARLKLVTDNINEWFSTSPITKEQIKKFQNLYYHQVVRLKMDYGDPVADMAREIYWKKRKTKFPEKNITNLRIVEQKQLETLETEIKKREQQRKMLEQKIQQHKSLNR